ATANGATPRSSITPTRHSRGGRGAAEDGRPLRRNRDDQHTDAHAPDTAGPHKRDAARSRRLFLFSLERGRELAERDSTRDVDRQVGIARQAMLLPKRPVLVRLPAEPVDDERRGQLRALRAAAVCSSSSFRRSGSGTGLAGSAGSNPAGGTAAEGGN